MSTQPTDAKPICEVPYCAVFCCQSGAPHCTGNRAMQSARTQPTDADACVWCGATEDEHDYGACMMPANPTFTARTPPPCAGDDLKAVLIEALAFVEEIEHREDTHYLLGGKLAEAIAALGTTPSEK